MITKPRGTKDYFKQEAWLKEYCIHQAIMLAKQFGYFPVETPIIEKENVFVRSFGVTSDVVKKELYTLQDRDGLPLVLRADGTAGLVRALIEQGVYPYTGKYYYHGPMFRYERPQKGRFRQFTQFGLEYIGNAHVESDIDIILYCVQYFHVLGINIPPILINSIGTIEERICYTQELKCYLEPFKERLSKDSQERLDKNPLRILDSKSESDQDIIKYAPRIQEYLGKTSKDDFTYYCQVLDQEGIPYTIDPFLVRGMDYYNGIIFEITNGLDGRQNTIAAGGRYDHFFKLLDGKEGVGIGVAIGIDRLLPLLDSSLLNHTSFVVLPVLDTDIMPSIHILHMLHQHGYAAELISQGRLAKRLSKASGMQVSLSIIVGGDEYERHGVLVKQMNTGKQQEIPIPDLLHYIKDIQKYL